MKYLHYFGTEAAFNQARENNYIEPWVSYTEGRGVDYNIDYTKIPLTVEALGSGDITWNLGKDMSVQYSKNKGPWNTLTKDISIPVVEGDEVEFKGNYSRYFSPSGQSYRFNCTARFNLKGNIMSLSGGDEFALLTALTERYSFSGIFNNNTTLISAEKLVLPATTLSQDCYWNLFRSCTSLVYPPAILPATVLASSCYQAMFAGCGSLKAAPKLPAITLANHCYTAMFSGCTSLEIAPKLPATELAPGCYGTAGNWPGADRGMFYGCTSLVKAPELPATTLVTSCYDGMFDGCTSLNYVKAMFTTAPSTTYTNYWLNGVASTGTFVKNAAATWDVTGVDGIPTGWTVQTATE